MNINLLIYFSHSKPLSVFDYTSRYIRVYATSHAFIHKIDFPHFSCTWCKSCTLHIYVYMACALCSLAYSHIMVLGSPRSRDKGARVQIYIYRYMYGYTRVMFKVMWEMWVDLNSAWCWFYIGEIMYKYIMLNIHIQTYTCTFTQRTEYEI